jgi:hypothetical protein
LAPLGLGGHMADGSGRVADTTTPPARRIELDGVFAQLLGVWYPKDYIVAAIEAAEGLAAVEALLAAGYGSNSLHLHDSARVCQIGAAIYEQRTPLQRVGAAFTSAVTDEGLMSQEYFDEAKAGASLIAVRASEPRLADEAREILAAHGARRMRLYGDRTITDLS